MIILTTQLYKNYYNMITEQEFNQILNSVCKGKTLTNSELHTLSDTNKRKVYNYLVSTERRIFDAIVLPEHERQLKAMGKIRYTHTNGIVFWINPDDPIQQQSNRTDAYVRQQRRNISNYYYNNQ